jgi:hypothetical protein
VFYDPAPPKKPSRLPNFCEAWEITRATPPGDQQVRVLDALARLPRVRTRREAAEYRGGAE